MHFILPVFVQLTLHDAVVGVGRGGVGRLLEEGLALVAAAPDAGVQRHLAQQGQAQLRTHALGAPGGRREDLRRVL